MLRSMTGYGRAEGKVRDKSILIEIRSVNHRYFDCSVHIHRQYLFLEKEMKEIVQNHASRGKIEVYVTIKNETKTFSAVSVNQTVSDEYFRGYQELIERYQLKKELCLNDFLNIPELFLAEPTVFDTEVAIFSDKVAIDEENIRIRSHIRQLEGMLYTTEPVGRKIDFLMQEFIREADIIASKCQNGDIAHLVVDMKAEIEKNREQVLNVE